MSEALQCIAIDDDPMSLKIIQSLIEGTDFLELKGLFDKPVEAVPLIEKVDLVFLDMEMPEISGLELLSSIQNPPQVIIVSRKADYALASFEYEVTDYIQKPVNQSRFLKAVMKAKRNLEKSEITDKSGVKDDHLFIKVDSVLMNFELSDILWVEAFGDYVKIQTNSKIHTVYSTMKNIEQKLPNDIFVRVHRSFIVNIHKIANIDLSNLQIKDKIIPIGSNYKSTLMSKIKIL